MGLVEALLVGLAAKRPTETVESLKKLNALRSALAGETMKLQVSDRRRSKPK
jgi:LysM repeat protein